MDANTVIQLGKEIEKQEILSLTNYSPNTVGWIGIIFSICFLLLLILDKILKAGISEFSSVLFFFSVLLLLFDLTFGHKIWATEEYEKMVQEWKHTVVEPYIASLPKEKKEIIYIKIDPEISSRLSKNHKYLTSTEGQKTPLTISFKDKKIVTITDWLDASMELTNESDPYVEIQQLKTDLGHDVEAGYYNAVVHLPNNYKFTEIK